MQDLFHLDDLLSAEQRLIRDSVRKCVETDILSELPAAFEQGVFPSHIVHQFAKLGLLGMTLPEQYGGSGADAVSYGLVCQELERGDSGLRSFVSVQSSLCMFPIFQYGSEEQKLKFLPAMAQAQLIGCFGLTEADAGSDPAAMKTTAKKVKDGWQLNGSKMWITNASVADLAIVWAKTADGIRGFIVEKEFDGFAQREIKHKMSLRASITGELIFENCFVPDDNYLPGSDKGLAAALACLSQARFGICWGVIGAASACYESALSFCKQRKTFNKVIAANQLVQQDLVAMYKEIVKAQCLNWRLAQLKDAGKAAPQAISLAKFNNCREALAIARSARNLLGASGISLEYPVIRHLLNLESVFTYEGTDNIHQLIVGKYLTDISAF